MLSLLIGIRRKLLPRPKKCKKRSKAMLMASGNKNFTGVSRRRNTRRKRKKK